MYIVANTDQTTTYVDTESELNGYASTITDPAGTTTYTYSSRGELLQVNLPDGRVLTYKHDPLSRRIAKLIDGVVQEQYLWQGRTRLLAILDGTGTTKYRFEYADDRMPVSMMTEGQRYYLAYDQVGSLRAVVSAETGEIVKKVIYDSFGNVVSDTNTAFTQLEFAGGLYDRDTGLVRFGFRDYDPAVGRWTAKDPIGFEGWDADLYCSVGNNPITYFDYLGLYYDDFNFSFGMWALA